ncbi:DUF11 domain-containing protein, partial [Nitratireductor sp. ZSWI3]|nr:DUF11 domain-containing protein [Nitratireductor sp. ZSWI3]
MSTLLQDPLFHLVAQHRTRRFSRLRAVMFGLAAVLGLAAPAAGQTPPSFGQCDERMFQLFGPPAGGSTTLYQISTSTNPFVYTPQGSAPLNHNAAGFNPADNYIYALSEGAALLRVGSNGAVQNLGVPSGLPVLGYNSGEFGDDGYYYVSRGSGSTMYRIDVTTNTATVISLSRAISIADLASSGGLLYAAENAGGPLIAIDPNTGTVTSVGATGVGGSFGAMFGAPNGVYGASNDGTGFYKFDKTTGAATKLSNAPSTGGNDGAKCTSSRLLLPVDLAVTKTDNKNAYIPGMNTLYTVVVRNNGPFGAQGVTVDDPLPAGITNMSWTCGGGTGGGACPVASGSGALAGVEVNLPANSTVTLTVTVEVPIDFSGDLVNTVTITAPDDADDSDTSDNSATDIDQRASIGLSKTGALNDANGNSVADAGETIDYTFTVSNTGGVAMSNVTVSDPKVTVTGGPLASLAAGASDSTTFTASYTLTQADIDAGEVMNQAEAVGTSPDGETVSDLSDDPGDATNADANGDGEPDDPTVVPLTQAGAHTLVKEGVLNDANGNGRPDAGETIAYTFTVTNTGNVSLTNIVVNDDKATVSGSPIAGPLAPGASDTSATGSYTVTQADIDTGSIENSATSTAKDPNGDDVTADSSPPGGNPGDPTSTPLTQEGDYDFVKEATHEDANG